MLLFSLCTECFDLGAFVVPGGILPPPSQMEEAIAQLQAKDTKERMAGVERLQVLLEQSRKSLSPTEVGNLVDASVSLLKDHNFRVCEGALQALASAAALAGEHLKVHFNALLPLIVERLGDGKQPVRDAGRRLLLALMEVFIVLLLKTCMITLPFDQCIPIHERLLVVQIITLSGFPLLPRSLRQLSL